MAVDVGALDWAEFTIPGSDRPVSLARLHADPERSFSLVVRFPAGWSRPGPGHYDAVEEVLFLEGDFAMTGRSYGAHDYGWFPVGYPREGSVSREGALALAWFSRPNRWFTEAGPEQDQALAGRVEAHWRAVEPSPSPLGGGPARLLRSGQRHASWVVDTVPAGVTTDVPVELFSLDARVWARVEAGRPLPALPGPAFCRIIRQAQRVGADQKGVR